MRFLPLPRDSLRVCGDLKGPWEEAEGTRPVRRSAQPEIGIKNDPICCRYSTVDA